jgi:hypothetical protein
MPSDPDGKPKIAPQPMFESCRDKGRDLQVAVSEQSSLQKSQVEGDPVETDGVGQAETNGIEKNG